MPVFEYKGRNNQGLAVDGTIDANSADAVATQLLNTGITPIDISQTLQDSKNSENKKNNCNDIDLLYVFSVSCTRSFW